MFEAALKSPLNENCKAIIVSRIFKEYECDRFMPEFEKSGIFSIEHTSEKYIFDEDLSFDH